MIGKPEEKEEGQGKKERKKERKGERGGRRGYLFCVHNAVQFFKFSLSMIWGTEKKRKGESPRRPSRVDQECCRADLKMPNR